MLSNENNTYFCLILYSTKDSMKLQGVIDVLQDRVVNEKPKTVYMKYSFLKQFTPMIVTKCHDVKAAVNVIKGA